jgi:Raf kinase inhibitor-like YbhB/YbcL family protein
MDDPDIPQAVKDSMHIDVFDHWVVFDIPPETEGFAEDRIPPGVEGGGARAAGYTGPCPPDKEHRYFFRLYALDTLLGLPEGTPRSDIEQAMKGHIVEFTELVGRYNRMRNRPS